LTSPSKTGARIGPTVLAASIAATFGAAFFFWTFPLDLLLGRPGYWDNPGGDPAQALMGYHAFARDAWRFPLFRTALMNPPQGVNIIFTDCIPILALLGKIFYKLTGIMVNYFGYWLLVSYVLQAVSGVLLVREIGVKSPLGLAAAGALFVLTPSFIFRFSHFPLVEHFTLLLAILFYLRLVKSPTRPRLIAFSAFAVLMFLINAYMFAMVAAIYMVAVAESVRRGGLPPRRAGLTAVLTGVVLVLVMVVSGGRDLVAAVGIGQGFGIYSMNLLSPVWPQLVGMSPNAILDATGGQYEGMNYLGMGVLALALVAVAVDRSGIWFRLCRRHPFLIGLMAGLFLYALSTDIWFGTYRLTHLDVSQVPIVSSIIGTFRVSGRFFWPVGYILVTGIIAVIARSLPSRTIPILLCLAVLLQFIDSFGNQVNAQVGVKIGGIFPLDHDRWADIVGRHKAVVIEPYLVCLPAELANSANVDLQILSIAAELGIPANSAYINRLAVDCDRERRTVDLAPLAEPYGSPALHIFATQIFSGTQILARKPPNVTCAAASFGTVCSSAAHPGFAVGQPGFDPVRSEFYRLGEVVSLSGNPKAREFLGAGWSHEETWGAWAVGPRSEILLLLDAPVEGDLLFRAEIGAFGAAGYLAGRAKVTVNGQALSDLSVPDVAVREVEFRIPAALVSKEPILAITFEFDAPKSPHDLGLSIDTRPVTWGFRHFSLAAPSEN
jgi:hypothetical protein